MSWPASPLAALPSTCQPEWFPPAGPRDPAEEFDWYVDIDTLADDRVVLLNQARSQVLIRKMRGAG